MLRPNIVKRRRNQVAAPQIFGAAWSRDAAGVPICPRDGNLLATSALMESRVHRCPGCGGLWIEAYDLQSLYQKLEVDPPLFLTKRDLDSRGLESGSASCPLDGAEMLLLHQDGADIDTCPSCYGIWLDRGELERMGMAPPQEDGALDLALYAAMDLASQPGAVEGAAEVGSELVEGAAEAGAALAEAGLEGVGRLLELLAELFVDALS